MAKTKLSALPDCKLTIQPPIALADTPNEILSEVLKAIRRLEPEQQNEVMKEVLKELGVDRSNARITCQSAHDRACKNLEDYVSFANNLEKIICQANEARATITR